MHLTKRAQVGMKMLAALCYVKHNPGCAKIDVALAIHPGARRALPASFASGYPTVDRCIAAGWVSAEVNIDARAPIYKLALTPAGATFLDSKGYLPS